jgi:hypothetical protein
MPTDSASVHVDTIDSDSGHEPADNSTHNQAPMSVTDIDRTHARQLVTDLAHNLVHSITRPDLEVSELHGHLSRLAALAAIRSATDELSAHTAATATAAGASYVDLGDAVGTTRQNARVRWPGLVASTRRKAGTTGDITTHTKEQQEA